MLSSACSSRLPLATGRLCSLPTLPTRLRRHQQSPPVTRHSTVSSDASIPNSAKPSSGSAPETAAGSGKVAAHRRADSCGLPDADPRRQCPDRTDHRLTALRQWLNAFLPGKSLVVLEPDLGLISDIVLCETRTPKNGLYSHTFWNMCKPRTCWSSTAILPRRVRFRHRRARRLLRGPTASNKSASPARQQTGQVRGDGDGQDLRADRASHHTTPARRCSCGA